MSLPSGYIRLEYIQSTGTQYINSKFKANQDTRVVIDFEYISGDVVFGAYDAAGANGFGLQAASKWYTYYGTSSAYSSTAVVANIRLVADVNKNVSTLNGAVLRTATANTFSGANPLIIFGIYNASAPGFLTALKIYSCQIYDNGTLIRDFIPCKNASGVIGLWDDVNSVFYQNAGSGTFTSGPEIKGVNKALIDGTGYDVNAGKCLVGGTAYALKKGRTLIGGTGYDISLKSGYTLDISIDGGRGTGVSINIDGVYSTSLSQYEGLTKTITNIPDGTKISVYTYGTVGYNTITFYVNGAIIGAEDGNYAAEATISKNGSFTCVYKTDPTFGVGAYVFELNC